MGITGGKGIQILSSFRFSYFSKINNKITTVFGLILSITGFFGSVATLLTLPSDQWGKLLPISLIIIFLLGLSVFIISLIQNYKINLAIPGVHELESITSRYHMEPATLEGVRWIAQLEADTYSSIDAVPRHVLEEWFSVNPRGFFLLKALNGSAIGHIDILPIRKSSLEKFLAGELRETDIRGESLYTPAERRSIKHLYIESVIVKPQRNKSSASALLHLLSQFMSMINNVGVFENIEMIYAIAASRAGEGLKKLLVASDAIDGL
ncbi:MAG: hypothetical protein HZB30_10670 [Nitrospirae bacterium]|nr:hypothetical protein [Nitrospirota bacterium]